ncbi:MAG: neutral/alkaline non-lysosomal ceramidase N-terminal domain-containing protein [Thermoguttaceae bacterium]|jgi:neutral ceramidase
MMKRTFILLAMFLFAVTSMIPAAEPAQLYTGAAAVDITPPIGFRLRGYFDERISTGVHDPIYFKALALQQGEKTAILLVSDTCSIPTSSTNPIRDEIAQKTGVPRESIIICATHSHTGPLFNGPLRKYLHTRAMAQNNGVDPCEPLDYEHFFIERGVEAIQKALENLRPSVLDEGQKELFGISFNRRFIMKDGSVRFNPGFDNPDKVRPAAGIDPMLTFLLFSDAETETPISSFTNFALHLDTTEGTLISGDYPYYLSAALQSRFGEDFVSVFGIGTAGDINHFDFAGGSEPRQAAEIGTILGLEAFSMIFHHGLDRVTPSLDTHAEILEWPKQKFTDEELEKAESLLHLAVAPEGEGLPFLDRARAEKIVNCSLHPDLLRLDVQAIRLSDDLAIVSLPGEIFVDLGDAIRKNSPFKRTIVLELAQGDYLYVPTLKAFEEGSYETINTILAPGGGEALVDKALEVLRKLKEKK